MVAGIVLCGGRSRRMGQSKAWLPFGPEFLLQRVVRIVAQVADPIIVVAAPGQSLPGLPDSIEIVRDPVADLGPLQGFAAGLAAVPSHVELVYLTATDAPFLKREWIARLRDRIGSADLIIPEVKGFPQPLAALYRHRTILPAALSLLRDGHRRLIDLEQRVCSVRLNEASLREIDPDLATVWNLNTPEDYERALGLLGCIQGHSPVSEV